MITKGTHENHGFSREPTNFPVLRSVVAVPADWDVAAPPETPYTNLSLVRELAAWLAVNLGVAGLSWAEYDVWSREQFQCPLAEMLWASISRAERLD